MTTNEIIQLSPEDRIRAIRAKIAEEDYGKTTREIINESNYSDEIPESKNVLHLYLTESQIELMYKLLDQEERKTKALIEKCTSFSKKDDYKIVLYNIDEIRKSITDQ